ncbi:MAG: leucine-rich repeat domain-containing protein [Candidatus Paceibacterota bacterium]
MDATASLSGGDGDYIDDDDEVMASLWEIWKMPLQNKRVPPGVVKRDIAPPYRVTHLSLSSCQLKGALPPQVGQLASLQSLNLSGNELTSLPSKIGLLSSLRKLYLSSNALTSLPSEIGLLTSLRKLYLRSNQLVSLPPEIGRLSSLQKLYLSGNALTGLPPEIGGLSSLRMLDLSRNALTSLPIEIGHLSSLQRLFLDYNALTSLPLEIGQLSSLRRLFLDYNQLAVLPSQAGLLSSLEWLHLDHNQLTSLPPEIGHLSSLRLLHLSNNRLASLPPEIGHLSALEIAYIAYNQLTSLPPEMAHLSSLRELYLDHNQLASLPSPSFFTAANNNFPSLGEIWLVDNCLITLPFHPTGSPRVVVCTQRLPVTLNACSFDIIAGDGDSLSPSASYSTVDDFTLHFYDDSGGGGNERRSTMQSEESCIHIADRNRLASRWLFFRRLLDAGLSEAHSGYADLSPFFSLRLGRCLVDYFEGKSVQVSSLSTRDCRDLVAHADYFGLGDTLLFSFCTTKLKRDEDGQCAPSLPSSHTM